MDLIYYPHLLSIEGEIFDIHMTLTQEMEERGKILLALLILATAFPLLAVLLTGFQVYVWVRVRKLKDLVAEIDGGAAAGGNGGNGARAQGVN